ncbi:MAG: hypothetical protein SF066_10560 [Thermoanaerobaculia bacterium]|nr:hypothetical protein [Thermoanaerobaculia bacterium]
MFRVTSRVSVVLTAALALGAVPVFAAAPQALEKSELQLKLESQGWSQVSKGVFERQLGENRVERQGYGPEGYAKALSDLSRQRDLLMEHFELAPSYELAKSIEELSAMIAKLRGELSLLLQPGFESAPQALDGPSCTSTCFTATADAYPLSTSQGVGATAEATFNSSCGILGETMATSFARAYQGTLESTYMQSDTKPPGSSLTSRTTVQAAGGNGAQSCFAQATAMVSSSQLGFVYTTFDYSDGICPAPPPTCSISGTNYVVLNEYSCSTETWFANASGGTPPYSYSWGGTTWSETLCPYQGQTQISLTVTDAAGQQCNTSLYVWVETQQQTCTRWWECQLQPF